MKTEYAYIGIKPCGCCVAATVDDPAHKNDVSMDVKEFIASGYSVERVKITDARIRLQKCNCTHTQPSGNSLSQENATGPRGGAVKSRLPDTNRTTGQISAVFEAGERHHSLQE